VNTKMVEWLKSMKKAMLDTLLILIENVNNYKVSVRNHLYTNNTTEKEFSSKPFIYKSYVLRKISEIVFLQCSFDIVR
jgi:hypothetical protein